MASEKPWHSYDAQLERKFQRQDRQQREQEGRRATPIDINPALALIPFLLLHLAWTSYMMSQSPEWKARVWQALERELGWRPLIVDAVASDKNNEADDCDDSFEAWITVEEENPASENDDGTDKSGRKDRKSNHLQHRIPCGLMIHNSDNAEEIFPMATLAISERVDIVSTPSRSPKARFSSEEGEKIDDLPSFRCSDPAVARSTLHARVLDLYPQLARFVVEVKASSPEICPSTSMIPKGAFRLRMGSVESTIEDSPPLWIVENDQTHGNGNPQERRDTKEIIDLVLGKEFWDQHHAAFETDEVYLVRNSNLGNEDPQGSRVMVPYMSMRSRPSFGTDL